jgi:hypothetical protein
MNIGNVWKSVGIGVVVGLLLQVGDPSGVDAGDRVLTVLACGGTGLLVGTLTEWLTSLLPARHARTGLYFAVNNLVALLVAGAATVTLVALESGGLGDPEEWWPVLVVVLAVVATANAVDYLAYRRTGARLREVQAALDAEPRAGADTPGTRRGV